MSINAYISHTLFVLLFILLVPMSSYTRDDNSINFLNKQSFRDIQDIAYEEEKPIFITFYASWSTPCVKVNREIYHHHKVAEFMNENFINYNANIEDRVGKSLSEYFDIYHLPTVLIISPRGDVIMKSSYLESPKKFLKWAKDANDIYMEQKAAAKAEAEGLAPVDKLVFYPISKGKNEGFPLSNEGGNPHHINAVLSNKKLLINSL